MAKGSALFGVRNPEDRSKKDCACGGHSMRARKKRRPWRRWQLWLERLRAGDTPQEPSDD